MTEVNRWGFPEKINEDGIAPREFEREQTVDEIKQSLGRLQRTLDIMKDLYIIEAGLDEPLEDLHIILGRFLEVEEAFFSTSPQRE